VKERIVPVTPEHGAVGGLRTTAKTPPAARDAATNTTTIISLVRNNYTKGLGRN